MEEKSRESCHGKKRSDEERGVFLSLGVGMGDSEFFTLSSLLFYMLNKIICV